MRSALRLFGILLVAGMLSGCVVTPVADWGPDGVTVKLDEQDGSAGITNSLGDGTGEQESVTLIGCDGNHVIPQVATNITQSTYREKVHLDGWLAASKNFPDGVGTVGGAEGASVASVIVQLTPYDNARQLENGRLSISKWDYPTTGIKARPPGPTKASDFPHPGWSVVGLVPANENVLKGFGGLDWNQKVSIEGWLLQSNDSQSTWYPPAVRATEDGECRIYAGLGIDGGFSGWMLVTSIKLEQHGTIDADNSYNPYSVRYIGTAGYLLLLMLAGAGAFAMFIASTGMIRTGAKWSAKEILSDAQMLAAKGIGRELKDAKISIEEVTGTALDLEKPKVEKQEKISKLDEEASVELDEFDVTRALRSAHRPDPRALGSRMGGGVTATEEADELDSELAELQEDLAAQRQDDLEAKKGRRRGTFVEGARPAEVSESDEEEPRDAGPVKGRKTSRKRKVKKSKPEPEPEPEPARSKREGPSVADDDDFSDFSL